MTVDLFASGTISGPENEQRGAFIELSWGGTEPVCGGTAQAHLPRRPRHEVVISASAPGPDGTRIGFGEVTGRISAGDRGGTISTGIRLARRRALDIEAGWTVEDVTSHRMAERPPRSRGGALAGYPRYPRRQPRCPAQRGSIVTSTSSFLRRRAASDRQMIEDTCQKVVGVEGDQFESPFAPSPCRSKSRRGRSTSFGSPRSCSRRWSSCCDRCGRSSRRSATAPQADNFDTVFRTLEQIQHSARTPIGVVRSVLAPVRPSRGGSPPVIEAEPLQTPGVIRIASMTVTMPSINGRQAEPLAIPAQLRSPAACEHRRRRNR